MALGALLLTYAVGVTACGNDEGPPRTTGINPTGGVGTGGMHSAGGGPATGACEGNEIQTCKVQIDANNCFVGEQQCQDGTWGPCVDPDTLDTAALTTQTNCPSNECNPFCQKYDEPTNWTGTGSASPPGGTIFGLPSAWQDAGQTQPCSDASDCQFDTYCNTSTNQCVPFAAGEFHATGAPDLTSPVSCTAGEVYVCNRGDAVATAPIEVAILDASPNHLSNADCTDPMGTVADTCVHASDIAPGDCALVTGCSWSGTQTIYVNPPDPPGTDSVPALAEAALAPNGCANNWSVYHNTSQCNCAAATTSSALTPVTMYLFLDDSGSMDDNPPSPDLWSSATSALTTFVQDASANNIKFAMRTYKVPDASCINSCSAVGCANPALTAAPDGAPKLLSDAAYTANLVSFIGAQTSSGGTPHSATIQGMADWGTTWKAANPSETVALVYITDGQNGNCGFNVGDDPVPVAAPAGTANAQGVLFFTVALPNANLSLMNEVANQGGTGSAIDLTMSSNVNADVTAALTAIQQSLLSCDLAIPNAGQVDLSTLNMEYLQNGSTSIAMTEVANAAACGGATPPYEYYISAADTVTMCAPACTALRADTTGEVNFLGGCIGAFTSFQTQEMYAGDCSGYPSAGPTWEFLTYDTDTPGDSEVIFEVRTGNTAAEAMASSWIEVARTTNAAPDATFGGGTQIDLEALLGPLAQQEFLELQATVNPTSDQKASPTVHEVELQLSCLSNE